MTKCQQKFDFISNRCVNDKKSSRKKNSNVLKMLVFVININHLRLCFAWHTPNFFVLE